jgi:hypothetical protein
MINFQYNLDTLSLQKKNFGNWLQQFSIYFKWNDFQSNFYEYWLQKFSTSLKYLELEQS